MHNSRRNFHLAPLQGWECIPHSHTQFLHALRAEQVTPHFSQEKKKSH